MTENQDLPTNSSNDIPTGAIPETDVKSTVASSPSETEATPATASVSTPAAMPAAANWWTKKRIAIGSVAAALVLAVGMTGTALITAALVNSKGDHHSVEAPWSNTRGGDSRDRGGNTIPDRQSGNSNQQTDPSQQDQQFQRGGRGPQAPNNQSEQDGTKDRTTSQAPQSSDAS